MNTSKKTTLKMSLAILLIGATLLFALGQTRPAHAAPPIIADGVNCHLAEAIASANADNANGNGCVDGSGADVIDLQYSFTMSTPSAKAHNPIITSEITLNGNGHTINGGTYPGFNGLRPFHIYPNGGNLTLNNVTITKGYNLQTGGGILNMGILTVNNSTISNNSTTVAGGSFGGGGGINNAGTLTVNNSTISGNTANQGAGIYNAKGSGGTVMVNNSTISGNSATLTGGGIYNSVHTSGSATVTVNNSTISNNSAGSGGGIYNVHKHYSTGSATVTVNNSTLSGNSADSGGGIYNTKTANGTGSATVTMNNSTLSGNSATSSGGGIYNTLTSTGSATANLNRSLISGNSATNGAEVYQNSGTVNANNYNVFGYESDARSYGFIPGANDIVPLGTLDTVLNITLADNGGSTWTHALVSGSPAIDLAPNTACIEGGVDQRGFSRPVDGNGTPSDYDCDAGAFEFVFVIP